MGSKGDISTLPLHTRRTHLSGEGWLEEKINEFNYRCSLVEDETERHLTEQLHDDIFSRARVYLEGINAKPGAEQQKNLVSTMLRRLKKKNNDDLT